MKKILLFLLIALLTGGALKAQNVDSSASIIEKKDLRISDITFANYTNGLYYVYANGRANGKPIDSIYISPLIPEEYWARIYLGESLSFQPRVMPISFNLKTMTVRFTIFEKRSEMKGKSLPCKTEAIPYASSLPAWAIFAIFLVLGWLGAWIAKRGWKIFLLIIFSLAGTIGLYILSEIADDYSFLYLSVPTGGALLMPYAGFLMYFIIKESIKQKVRKKAKERALHPDRYVAVNIFHRASQNLGPNFPWEEEEKVERQN